MHFSKLFLLLQVNAKSVGKISNLPLSNGFTNYYPNIATKPIKTGGSRLAWLWFSGTLCRFVLTSARVFDFYFLDVG